MGKDMKQKVAGDEKEDVNDDDLEDGMDDSRPTTTKRERKRKRKEEKARKRLKREEQQQQLGGESTSQDEDKRGLLSEEDDALKQKKQKKKDKKKKKETKGSMLDSEEEEDTKPHDHKKDKKDKKKRKKEKKDDAKGSISDGNEEQDPKEAWLETLPVDASKASTTGRIVASSAIEFYDEQIKQEKKRNKELSSAKPQEQNNLTLLLFYQYVEPVWDEATYNFMLKTLQELGSRLGLTGRMRVAREGLNCTVTATNEAIMEYCATLRKLRPKDFESTEFKLTTDLPLAQRFPNLKVFKVVELVHYGLEGRKAPPIAKFQGTHLDPKDYHEKIAQPNTVIIDVRNHYEAAIGRFVPPTSNRTSNNNSKEDSSSSGALWLDPKMRKSTEFPVWLDKPETKEMMKGKQVLMYCTGGIRCERASALLKYKMETDPEIKELGIQGVFQLQGGIDRYFKEFPDGGYWQGKNYVFDKRFAHAPPKVDGELHGKVGASTSLSSSIKPPAAAAAETIMGQCESCLKPWDMYRGKRRCPTCGVPSLICRDCFLADKEGRKKLGKQVRCDLCVEQGITSKHELRERDQQEIEEYERKMSQRGLLRPEEGDVKAPNPDQVTRLQLKNMCRKSMDEATLMESVPGITHIVWRQDRKSGNFLGQGWVEMATPDDAARAVARDGKIKLFGRPLYISFQPPDGKDAWPPSSSAVDQNR